MIIKHHKGFNAVILGIAVSIILVLLSFSSTNTRIIIEDIRESIHTYNLGFSRMTSWDDSLSATDKIKFALNMFPTIIYKNIVGFERQNVDELFIHIDFEDYQKILSDRADAIQLGLLRNPNEVDAIVEYNGEKYAAKARLKGDLPDHWLSQYRMSLRLKLKKGKTIFGLNEFSVQKTRARTFPYDAVFQEMSRSNGLLATKHNYAKVKFNGNHWGVMNIESHVTKEFLETEKRKDSIVVRLSNEDGWMYHKVTRNPDYSYRISNPLIYTKLYDPSKKMKDEINRARFSYIVNQKFLSSEGNLYDTESYLKLLLLSHIWGTDHALYINNIKHYFNPYTLKLEPISSDQVEPRENDFSPCAIHFRFTSTDIYNNLDKRSLSLFNVKEELNNIRNKIASNIDNSIKSNQTTPHHQTIMHPHSQIA